MSHLCEQTLINSKGKAEITDDTQMTIFTADGLIKSLLKKLNLAEMPDMKEILSKILETEEISIKAKTNEKMDAVGNELTIEAHAVVMLINVKNL